VSRSNGHLCPSVRVATPRHRYRCRDRRGLGYLAALTDVVTPHGLFRQWLTRRSRSPPERLHQRATGSAPDLGMDSDLQADARRMIVGDVV
jgi:hypothetical protein